MNKIFLLTFNIFCTLKLEKLSVSSYASKEEDKD